MRHRELTSLEQPEQENILGYVIGCLIYPYSSKIFLFRLFSRSYFVSLNLCLVVIGVLRPIWLFHDPYNEELSWPRPVAYLLVDTGLPCMTSAFAVLFLALLRATQIELVSPGFQVLYFLPILRTFMGIQKTLRGKGGTNR